MKVSLAEEELSIIKESLQREFAFLESKTNMLKKEVEALEIKYGLSSEEFVERFENGTLGDEQDYFEWWGLMRGLKKVEYRIEKISTS